MATDPAQPATEPASGSERAKHLILRELGVRRVAAWCRVSEMAVYKWFEKRRGTDDSPIPTKYVAAIVAGAKAEGLEAPIGVLWPAMAEAQS